MSSNGPVIMIAIVVLLICCCCSSSIVGLMYTSNSTTSPATVTYPPGVPTGTYIPPPITSPPPASSLATPSPSPSTAPSNSSGPVLVNGKSYSFTNKKTNKDLTVCYGCVTNSSAGTKSGVVLQTGNHSGTSWDTWTLASISGTAFANVYTLKTLVTDGNGTLLSYCHNCITGASNSIDIHGTDPTIQWTQWIITPVTGSTNLVTIKSAYGDINPGYLACCTGNNCPASIITAGSGASAEGVTFVADSTDASAQWIVTVY